MKFIHLSNIGLGTEPFVSERLTVDRAADTMRDFLQILELCQTEDVDALFITGMLYVRTPSQEELKDLDERFLRLSNTRVFFAPGVIPDGGDNHVYSDYPWRSNTHVFSGESIQRIHVSRFSMEVTGVGYQPKSWHKVKPANLGRGRKGAIQVLLLPFEGEAFDTGDPEKLRMLPFDYIGVGQKTCVVSDSTSRVFSPGIFESEGFEDTERHGFIMGEMTTDGKKRPQLSCRFTPLSCREYLEIRVNADPQIRYQEIEEQVKNAISQYGAENIYRIIISGTSSPSLYIMKNNLYQLGSILEVRDETDTDEVRKLLSGGNDEAVVTRFVDTVLSEEDSQVKQKAIQYGIDALLEAE